MFNFFLILLATLPLTFTQEDQELLQLFSSMQEVSSQQEIPKTLHFIWLGPEPFPQGSTVNVEKWMQLHPGWKVKFWADVAEIAPCAGMQLERVEDYPFSQLQSCYEQSDNFGEKSQILRYEILAREGGLYVDHDLMPKKAFAETGSLCCPLLIEEHSCLSSSILLDSCLLGATVQHPVLLETIKWLKEHFSELGNAYSGTDSSAIVNRVQHRTLAALLHGVKEKGKDSSAHLLSQEALSSLAEHGHALSWVRKEPAFDIKMRKMMQQIEVRERYTLILLVASLALFFLSRRRKKT